MTTPRRFELQWDHEKSAATGWVERYSREVVKGDASDAVAKAQELASALDTTVQVFELKRVTRPGFSGTRMQTPIPLADISYRGIEKYHRKPLEELKHWARFDLPEKKAKKPSARELRQYHLDNAILYGEVRRLLENADYRESVLRDNARMAYEIAELKLKVQRLQKRLKSKR